MFEGFYSLIIGCLEEFFLYNLFDSSKNSMRNTGNGEQKEDEIVATNVVATPAPVPK